MSPTDACPYKKCDGSGLIFIKDTVENIEFAKDCECREERIIESRLKFANIPEEFKGLTIHSFQIDLYKTDASREKAALAKKAAANYVKNYEQMRDIGKGLYLYSYIKGSGKTRLAVSIGNALIKVHKSTVKYITTINLLKEIKRTFGAKNNTTSELLDAMEKVEVLILDDIGTEKPSEFVNEVFYGILNERMVQKKITIFTSNISLDELDYKDEGRIKSRIEKMVFPVHLPDESIRSDLTKAENEDLQLLLFD